MSYVLGVDQGNSKTEAAVADLAGRILGVGRAPGGYPTRRPAEAMQHLQEAATAALAQAGLSKEDIALLYGGLTSADWPDEYAQIRTLVAELALTPRVCIVNDTIVALRGGTSHPYGAIVVAGTGSNCGIHSPHGETYLYHYYVEDALQGGVALGRRTLTAIYRAETGREPATQLTALALHHFDYSSVDALLRADCERRFPVDDVKHLAPLVFQAAAAGDEVAHSIISAFGQGLAELVTAGLRRFNMADLPVEVVVSGSIFKGEGGLLQRVMLDAIQATARAAQLVDARYEPVVGAVLLGLEELGIEISPTVQQAIETSSVRHGLIRLNR